MRQLVSIILVSLIIGCGARQKGTTAGEQCQADTLTADTIAFVDSSDVTMQMLPDTVYPSARNIRYKVELIADKTDSVINSLDNLYDKADGIFAFRKGPGRQADFEGKLKGLPDTIAVDWCFTTDFDTCTTRFGIWGGGTGWTGQPLYVKWDKSAVERIKLQKNTTADFSGEEIIVGSLCGNIYFLNFSDGRPSRTAIAAGNPIKGTVSLDPVRKKLLYVGQGVPARRPFGHMVVDIDKGEIGQFMPEDRKAYRGWGAFDSSPIRVGQFLFWPSENGSVYKYLCDGDSLRLHSVMRYTVRGAAPGMEASLCVYRNYGYTADNHGNLVCINLNTLRPVWSFENGDDTDASVVLSEEDGIPYIYTGCEVDRRGDSTAYFRKLNALTGELTWENKMHGKRVDINEKHFDGGYYATPLLGTGNCARLVFANCVTNTNGQNGCLVAFERKTGKIVYRTPLKRYAWSSPVGLTNENDEMFIFTADTFGHVYLINGSDGTIIYKEKVGYNFESSPVLIGNSVVIGSRGRYIYKMTIM